MKDPKRIKRIIKKLKKVWKQHPDLNLNKLLWNISRSDYAFIYVDDDFIEKKLDKVLLTGNINE